MSPLRDSLTTVLLNKLRSILAESSLGLTCLEEHVIDAQDDWNEGRDAQDVKCWWAIFGHAERQVKP